MSELDFKVWVYSEQEEFDKDKLITAILNTIHAVYPTAYSVISGDDNPIKKPEINVIDKNINP